MVFCGLTSPCGLTPGCRVLWTEQLWWFDVLTMVFRSLPSLKEPSMLKDSFILWRNVHPAVQTTWKQSLHVLQQSSGTRQLDLYSISQLRPEPSTGDVGHSWGLLNHVAHYSPLQHFESFQLSLR